MAVAGMYNDSEYNIQLCILALGLLFVPFLPDWCYPTATLTVS